MATFTELVNATKTKGQTKLTLNTVCPVGQCGCFKQQFPQAPAMPIH
jgi:hypothetical protein